MQPWNYHPHLTQSKAAAVYEEAESPLLRERFHGYHRVDTLNNTPHSGIFLKLAFLLFTLHKTELRKSLDKTTLFLTPPFPEPRNLSCVEKSSFYVAFHSGVEAFSSFFFPEEFLIPKSCSY